MKRRHANGGLRTAGRGKDCPKVRQHWALVRRLGRRLRRRREHRQWTREAAQETSE